MRRICVCVFVFVCVCGGGSIVAVDLVMSVLFVPSGGKLW